MSCIDIGKLTNKIILHLISVANVFLSGYPYPGINRRKWIFWIVQYIFKRNYVDIPTSNVRYVRAQDFKSDFFPESQYFAKYNGSLATLFTIPWLKLLIPNLVNHWQQCSHLTAAAGDRWLSAHRGGNTAELSKEFLPLLPTL